MWRHNLCAALRRWRPLQLCGSAQAWSRGAALLVLPQWGRGGPAASRREVGRALPRAVRKGGEADRGVVGGGLPHPGAAVGKVWAGGAQVRQ